MTLTPDQRAGVGDLAVTLIPADGDPADTLLAGLMRSAATSAPATPMFTTAGVEAGLRWTAAACHELGLEGPTVELYTAAAAGDRPPGRAVDYAVTWAGLDLEDDELGLGGVLAPTLVGAVAQAINRLNKALHAQRAAAIALEAAYKAVAGEEADNAR